MAQYPNNQDAGGIWKLKDIWVAIGGENWVKDLSGDRGLFGGGYASPANTNVIDFISIAAAGNATDFGDLTQAGRAFGAGISSSTRGIFGPRRHTPSPTPHNDNTFDFVTIASAGKATDFGD